MFSEIGGECREVRNETSLEREVRLSNELALESERRRQRDGLAYQDILAAMDVSVEDIAAAVKEAGRRMKRQ